MCYRTLIVPVLGLLMIQFKFNDASNILAVKVSGTKSHNMFFEGVISSLLEEGHKVVHS